MQEEVNSQDILLDNYEVKFQVKNGDGVIDASAKPIPISKWKEFATLRSKVLVPFIPKKMFADFCPKNSIPKDLDFNSEEGKKKYFDFINTDAGKEAMEKWNSYTDNEQMTDNENKINARLKLIELSSGVEVEKLQNLDLMTLSKLSDKILDMNKLPND